MAVLIPIVICDTCFVTSVVGDKEFTDAYTLDICPSCGEVGNCRFEISSDEDP